MLTDVATPCGEMSGCSSGSTPRDLWSPEPSFTFSSLACEALNVTEASSGDRFCCVPRPPSPNSTAFYNANTETAPITSNPDFGFTSFDSLPEAWLVVYRAVTIEDWSAIMRTFSGGFESGWGAAFFMILVLAPGWLAANLALAVIYEQVGAGVPCSDGLPSLAHSAPMHMREGTCN
jgi:hypothetical protein